MIGKVISHYKILEELGRGGMSVVYRAQDLTLPRSVALKFLHAHLSADEETKQRFIREAKAISLLDHPNICTIYEVGETDDGQLFIAMAYYEGETLQKKIEGGRLRVEEALDYVRQTAQGLRVAHQEQVAHRDIKPANLIVTSDGVIKILDFGLAKEIGGERLTNTRMQMGTLFYMSPEQYYSEPDIDHRTDIWSLGVVFYELLTGELPFYEEYEQAVGYVILNEPPKPMGPLRGELPRSFERLISKKLLVKKREDRCQQIDELLVDLKSLDEEWTALHKRKESEKTRRIRRFLPRKLSSRLSDIGRRRKWLGISAAALLLLALVLVQPVRARLNSLACKFVPTWYAPCQIPSSRHLSVLPFESLGDDATSQVYGEGLAHSLTGKLRQLPQFHESLCIHGSREGGPEIGTNLALSGTVERTGDTVRLTASLWNPRTSVELRTLALETQTDDIALLQDGLAPRFAEMLELQPSTPARSALMAGGTAIHEAYDAYLAGLGHLQRDDLDSAISRFEQALGRDPYYPSAHAGLGDAYRNKYNRTNETQWLGRAAAAYRRAIDHNEQSAQAYLGLGRIHATAGRQEQAIEAFRRALDLNPLSLDAGDQLVGAYEAAGRLKEAESATQAAIELRPKCWYNQNRLGVFYWRYGRYNEAERQFKEAIKRAPDENYLGYRNLGGVYLNWDRSAEAEAPLRESIGIKPTASAYSNLGYMYYRQRRYADAVQMFEKTIELDPHHYRAWGNLGEILLKVPELEDRALGAFHRAIEFAEHALAKNPNDPQLLATMANAWAQLSRREKSPAAREKALEAKRQALDAIEKALEYAPENVNVTFRAALVYEMIGMRDRALSSLEAALDAGFSLAEITGSSLLEELRKDPRYQKMMEVLPASGTGREAANR